MTPLCLDALIMNQAVQVNSHGSPSLDTQIYRDSRCITNANDSEKESKNRNPATVSR